MTTWEAYERADDELFHINEAIDHLKGVRNSESVVEVLKDMAIVIGFEREKYHRLLEEQNRREDAELTREHYLAVL